MGHYTRRGLVGALFKRQRRRERGGFGFSISPEHTKSTDNFGFCGQIRTKADIFGLWFVGNRSKCQSLYSLFNLNVFTPTPTLPIELLGVFGWHPVKPFHLGDKWFDKLTTNGVRASLRGQGKPPSTDGLNPRHTESTEIFVFCGHSRKSAPRFSIPSRFGPLAGCSV